MRVGTVIFSAVVCLSVPFACSDLPTGAGESSEVAGTRPEAGTAEPQDLIFRPVIIKYVRFPPAWQPLLDRPFIPSPDEAFDPAREKATTESPFDPELETLTMPSICKAPPGILEFVACGYLRAIMHRDPTDVRSSAREVLAVV